MVKWLFSDYFDIRAAIESALIYSNLTYPFFVKSLSFLVEPKYDTYLVLHSPISANYFAFPPKFRPRTQKISSFCQNCPISPNYIKSLYFLNNNGSLLQFLLDFHDLRTFAVRDLHTCGLRSELCKVVFFTFRMYAVLPEAFQQKPEKFLFLCSLPE